MVIVSGISVNGQLGDIFPKEKIDIIDFQTINTAYAEESFLVNITIENNRVYPVKLSIRVDLLNGMLECMKKEIGKENLFVIEGKKERMISIPCVIRAGDIDWYKEEYNVKAIVFRESPLIDRSVQTDISTVRGIHVQSMFSEKDKAKILDVTVKDTLKKDEDSFTVNLLIKNDGYYPIDIWACIDLVDKSSVMPELEEYIDLKGLSPERKQVGNTKRYIPIKSGCKENVIIPCKLSKSEMEKKRFNIQAVLVVELDGNEYTVDMSSLYGIYHEQPICRGWFCWILYGVIPLGLVLGGVFVFWFVRRRRYHL
jgi:hypothetical protein